jgi:ElaA protein
MAAGALTFSLKPFATLTIDELHELVRLREEVFVVGQRITAEAEFDGKDPEAHHVLARAADGTLLATARLMWAQDPVKVGRVCVEPTRQRGGLGSELMGYVHQVLGARAGVMSAQAHLEPWYVRLGWQPVGPVYDECGIPHRRLVRAGQAR